MNHTNCGLGRSIAVRALSAFVIASALATATGCAGDASQGQTAATTAAVETPANSLAMADATHAFTVANMLTSFRTFRSTSGASSTFTWYSVSQMAADIEMYKHGRGEYRQAIYDDFDSVSFLWRNSDPMGGYFADGNIDKSSVDTSLIYLDDNALAGMVYMQAYYATGDTKFLTSAEAVANYLMFSGQWDDTYGGGFWWCNGSASNNCKVKPTEANALAAQLFLNLYHVTGTYDSYGAWARSLMTWLNTAMRAPSGLYDRQRESAGYSNEYCAADQAMMIDANLYAYATWGGGYLSDAQALARNTQDTLWTNNGYLLSTKVGLISAVYAGWMSEALMNLYRTDGDTTWRRWAVDNVTAIDGALLDKTSHGYFANCWSDGTNRSTAMQTVDQAWMQLTHAAIAE